MNPAEYVFFLVCIKGRVVAVRGRALRHIPTC